jgi:mRNA interferase RelE/StbE
MAMRYEIDVVVDAKDDLRQLRSFDRQRIVEAIERHLAFEPRAESRSRIKRLQQPTWAEYRLRVDEYRVYYNVYDDRGIIEVLRILWKGAGQMPEEAP